MTKNLKIRRGWPKSSGTVADGFWTSLQKHLTSFHKKIWSVHRFWKKYWRVTVRRLFADNTVMKKFTLVKIKYHNYGIFHEKSKSYLKVYRSGRTISNWTVAHWCFLPMQSQHYKCMWEMVNIRMYQTLQYRFMVRRMRHDRDYTHTHNYAARKISSKPLPTRLLLCPKPLIFRSWCLNSVWKGHVGIWSQWCRI